MNDVGELPSPFSINKLPRFFRSIIWAVGIITPQLMALIAGYLLTITWRQKPRHGERDVLELGRKSSLDDLSIWTWGEGPKVLLIHGWNGRVTQFGSFIQPLVEKGYQVIGFDFPGHGDSPGHSASFLELRNSITAIGKEFGPFHTILAHSAGAVVTTSAVVDGVVAGRLVYIAPPIGPSHWLDSFAYVAGIEGRVKHLMWERFERQVGSDIDQLKLTSLSTLISAPLLVVHDVNDSWVPWSVGKELSESWTRSRIISTKGLGHHRILRSSDVCNRVTSYIEEPLSSVMEELT